MTQELVLDIMRRSMVLATATATPILGIGMIVGLFIAVIQAATQIQESSLNFVPKLVAIGIVLLIAGPWMLDTLVSFTRTLFSEMVFLAPGVMQWVRISS